MPRKHTRKMNGGFFNDLWEKTKKATTDAYNKSGLTGTASTSYTPPPAPTPVPTPTPAPASPALTPVGGKTRRRRRRRHMKGGFKDNTPTTGLVVHAAPFSGSTAKPHNWVGGRTKKRHHRKCYKKHRHTKSCRHRR